MQQARIQRLIVSRLLGVIPDQHNIRRGKFHCAASLGGDFDLSIAGSDRADNSLLIGRTDVQFFIGRDLRDRGKLQRHIPGELRVQYQSLAVGFHDRTRQVVAIL